MPTRSLIRCALVSLLASALPLAVVHGENGAPVYLQANDIRYDQASGLSTYRGKVRLTRADLRIRADTASVRQRNNEIASVRASGKPIVLRKGLATVDGLTVIRGEQLEFNTISNTIIITGNVITTRGRDTIRSARLTYHLDNNHIIADRDSNAAPVLADLWPRAGTTPEQ